MSLKNHEYSTGHSSLRGRPDMRQRINPFFIGVSGGTGAGKTTFSRKLAKTLSTGRTVTVVDLDSYHKDLSLLRVAERRRMNIDAPESLDFDRLYDDLCRLKRNRPSLKPSCDMQTYMRSVDDNHLAPAEVVIAEGSMVFVDDNIRILFDLKVFIDTLPDIRLRRRLERDVRERGCLLADAIEHYVGFVLPIYDHFIEPAKHCADLIIDGCNDADVSFSDLASLVWRSIKNEESLGRAHIH
jgi:uridine kinase